MIHMAMCFLWEKHQQWPGVVELSGGAGQRTWDLQAGDLGEECQGRPSHLPRQQGWEEQVSVHKGSLLHLVIGPGRTPRGGTLTYGNGVWCTPNGCAWEDLDRS